MVDLIVPTIPGREDSLARCVDSYSATAAGKVNPIVIEESKTCGWGWRQGLAQATADYVLLACDDQESTGEGWDRVCMMTVSGMLRQLPCPRVWTPNGTIASQGGDMDAYAHIIRRPQRDWAPVDYTVVPFMSREQASRIGMIDVHYCSDVWVSYRGRQLGYETVLRHGFEIVHYEHPVGRGAGMTVLERDAMDEQTLREALKEGIPA